MRESETKTLQMLIDWEAKLVVQPPAASRGQQREPANAVKTQEKAQSDPGPPAPTEACLKCHVSEKITDHTHTHTQPMPRVNITL